MMRWPFGLAVSMIGLCGVFAVGVCGATQDSLAHSSWRSDFLDGVSEIAAPGIPGTVAVLGPDAACMVAAPSGGVQAAVVAAAETGAGRMVAMGHNGYLAGRQLAVADTGRLMLNAVRWLGRDASPRVTVVSDKGVAAVLEKQGISVAQTDMESLEETMADARVIVVDAHQITSAAQLRRLTDFLDAGGGILTSATGWGWQQLNPGKALNRDFLGNTLLARAGLAFTGAMTKRTSGKGFDATAEISPYVHAARALDMLIAQHEQGAKLAENDLKQIATSVSTAARAVSVDETRFRPRIETLLSNRGEPIIPSRQAPVGNTQGLERLVVALTTDRLSQTPAEEVVAHPAAADFPGAVPEDAERIDITLPIDTRVPRWHSTGLYAAPGEVITMTIPEPATGKGLVLRIGAHKDGIWGRADWWRYPEITRTFKAQTSETHGACAFGGLVYVDVPRGLDLGEIEVTLQGGVRAPFYQHGKTDLATWRETIRHYPAPWAEVGSDKVIITVPSENVRELDDPAALMTFWDSVMDACADLAVRDRTRTSPERYVADRQISVGYMHAGYPIMTFLDAAPRFVNLEHLRTQGDWGMFHEMGHNHQSRDWTFAGAGEVTVNLFSLYILETCCSEPPERKSLRPDTVAERLHQYIVEQDADFKEWKRKPFLALVMYIQLQQAFGWDAFKTVFAEYRDLPDGERPKSDDEKRDQWLVRMSRTVERNLGPFFEAWGVPTSQEARAEVADLPLWMPEGFPPEKG